MTEPKVKEKKKRGVPKGRKTSRKATFLAESMPVPSGYYPPPKLTGLTPFHRAIARAWASGNFRTKTELAEAMGVSGEMLVRLFKQVAFTDEVDRITIGIAAQHADLADDVRHLAGQAIETYAAVISSKDMPLSARARAAKDVIEWAIKIDGLAKGSGGGQRAGTIVNQQINIAEASEDQLRRIISDNTGIGSKEVRK